MTRSGMAAQTVTSIEAQAAVAVTGLSVRYEQRLVLDNIQFRLPQGTMSAIVGPNGAGKSTLLKAILGLVRVDAGQVQVLGQPFRPGVSAVAYVPQRSSVDWDFPATVLDVVMMGRYGQLPWWRWPGKAERQMATAALARVGLDDLVTRRISDLSGGQQQRVFLARALVQEARLYLLDEPFSGVDAASEAVMVGILHELCEAGASVIAVHHDLATVQRYFSHLLLLNRTVVSCGPVVEAFTTAALQQAYGGYLLNVDEAR